jgi:3-hydroxyisobutyrate dehydrogenase-like beta-hydroxyacid dehydrogenase
MIAAVAEQVGFIGLGIMGSRMAACLARAGFELTVFNRTRERAEEWVAEHGGTVAASPADVARASDVVITMVVDGPQVEGVLLGTGSAQAPGPPVVEGAHDGLLCVDMSTISPMQTRTIGERLAARGVRMMDAPVTGSAPRAQDGTLTIIAGGEREDLDRVRPLLEAMGELVVHAGPLGQGEAIKLINNAVAAVNCATVGQALLAAHAAGLDLDALVEAMGAGSGASAMLELKADPMRTHDYTPLFKLEHMLKDVRLCLEQAAQASTPFPLAQHTREVLEAATDRGRGEDDFAAMIEVLEEQAHTRL